MNLFHGTSAIRGKEILSCGILRSQADRICNHLCLTSNGYVYLTNSLANAIYYGNRSNFFDYSLDERFYVFQLEVPGELLEIDVDEFKFLYTPEMINFHKSNRQPTLEDSLNIAKSVRVKQDLPLKKLSAKYITLPSTRFNGDADDNLRPIILEIVNIREKENEYTRKFLKEQFDKFIWHSI